MTIAVGDILRFVAKGTLAGQEWNQVWHQSVTAGSTESDLTVLTALRDELDNAFTAIDQDLTTGIISTECELYVWDSVLNRFDGTAQIAWSTFVGTDAGNPLMNQQALLITFFTQFGRRQARKYLAGAVETEVVGNAWAAGIIASAVAFAAVMDDALVTGSVTCTPCVFNTDPASPLFETLELFSGVTAVDSVPSTQRRRKLGVGI